MKTICIAAERSDLGKTVLSEKLLSRLNNWAACKVTICTDGPHVCPRGKRNCGVCSSLKEDYVIETDKRIISQNGKDTARLLKAGAREVFWVKSKEPFIKKAVDEVLVRFKGFNGVIFEGNGSLKGLRANFSVMIISSNGKIKKSAKDIREKIDMFVEDTNDETIDKILTEVNHGMQ